MRNPTAHRLGLAVLVTALSVLAATPVPAQERAVAPAADAWVQLEARVREAIRRTPGVGDLHATLAESLWRQGRLPEAERSVRDAIRLDPANPVYRGVLGQILLAGRHWPEAAAHFRLALRGDSLGVESHVGLAHALVAQGDTAAARAALSRAGALDPDHPGLAPLELALREVPTAASGASEGTGGTAPWPIRLSAAIFRGASAAVLAAAGAVLALAAAGALFLGLVRAPAQLLRGRDPGAGAEGAAEKAR